MALYYELRAINSLIGCSYFGTFFFLVGSQQLIKETSPISVVVLHQHGNTTS